MSLAYKRGFHAGRDGESFRLKKAYLRPFANAEFIAGYSAGINAYAVECNDYFGGNCWDETREREAIAFHMDGYN